MRDWTVEGGKRNRRKIAPNPQLKSKGSLAVPVLAGALILHWGNTCERYNHGLYGADILTEETKKLYNVSRL